MSTQFSENTLTILKNFAAINDGIVIHPGKKIQTKSPTNSILAIADIEEEFTKEIALSDLNQFLGTLLEFESPVFDFDDKSVTISEKNDPRIKFLGVYGDASTIIYPTRQIKMPPTKIQFDLSDKDLTKILKMATIQNLPNIVVTKENGKVILVATNIKNSSSNTFTLNTESQAPKEDFKMIFEKQHLLLVKGSYKVQISNQPIAQFTNEALNLTYWIAADEKSTYGK